MKTEARNVMEMTTGIHSLQFGSIESEPSGQVFVDSEYVFGIS